ncbi:DUF6402 family protein [Enterobacteriaceae bacterium ESL0689]|nr:DUF6402 family protein [Enterobacteriaceae bacterium ESL0689]
MAAGWPVAAQLIRHWFNIKPAFAFDSLSRTLALESDATILPDSQVNSDIMKMSWAMKYEQINNGIIKLTQIWKSIKGIKRLKEQLNSCAK